jgi:phage-related protein (TIGR01555 family)
MLIWDGLKNLVSSLGTSKDKASATMWQANARSYEDFEQLYRSSAFARKIVDIPTGDMLRRWRGWSADDQFVTGIETQEKRRRVRKVVGAAHRFGRCFGSSAIIINTHSGTLADPLINARMPSGDLVSLRVDVYPRLRIESWDVDTGSATFGEPLTYIWQPVVRGFSGTSVRVHGSRVIPFSGVPLTPFHANRLTEWGESVFVSLEETLNTAGTTTSVIHSMLHEAKKDIISTDLSRIGTPEGEERVKARFALGNYLKSVNNMLLLGSEEKYQQMTLNFAGLPDIHIRMLQELAGAADIPATRLLSQAPAGMSSTGESDLRNYYDSLSAKQEDELREPIERLDALLEADAGLKRDPGAFWYFHPLWQETSTQKAENAWKRAQGTKLIVETGLIPAPVMQKALISQLVEA